MVQGHATHYDIEVVEFWGGELGGMRVGGLEEGALVGAHEGGGEPERGRGAVVLIGALGLGDIEPDELT